MKATVRSRSALVATALVLSACSVLQGGPPRRPAPALIRAALPFRSTSTGTSTGAGLRAGSGRTLAVPPVVTGTPAGSGSVPTNSAVPTGTVSTPTSTPTTPPTQPTAGASTTRTVPATTSAPASATTPFTDGMSLLLYGNPSASQLSASLGQLAALGATSVQLSFMLHPVSVSSTSIVPTAQTPSDATLATAVTLSRSLGMRAVLRPLIGETALHAQGYWRGQLAPTSVPLWFAGYTRLMVGYAALAQSSGAAGLSVGTELVSLEPYASQWLALIRAVRAVYGGQVTYSANWTISPGLQTWGRALSYVGIDEFSPLAVPLHAPTSAMTAALEQKFAALHAEQQQLNVPVVLSEIGVASQQASYRTPWQWNNQLPPDPRAQVRYYQAVVAALQANRWIRGVWWWGAQLPAPPALSAQLTSFSPVGKPAAAVVAQFFGARP